MAPATAFIVWPAPGLPALLHGDQHQLSLIVASRKGDARTVGHWADQLTLRGKSNVGVIPLAAAHVEALDREEPDPLVHGFASLPHARGIDFWRVHMRLPPLPLPAAPRRVELYDLVGPAALEKSRAVAVLANTTRQLSLAFATDLHVAALWNRVMDSIEAHAPEWLPSVVDPRQMLNRFIHKANALWARGELDLVVLGGDLVDHVHKRPRRQLDGKPMETNVHELVRLLAPLRVPTIAIPGNHDHRLYPWRPRTYGLSAIGLSAGQTRRLLKAAGMWGRWPLHEDDFSALRTVDDAGRPGLAHHLALLAPATDFSIDLHGTRLVLASTGADAIARWRSFKWASLLALIRGLPASWTYPDSEGLDDGQLRRVAATLHGARGAAVFFHTPLLHAPDHDRIEDRIARLDLDAGGTSRSRNTAERALASAGVRRGGCFRNTAALIQSLLACPSPLVTFSGHLHRSTAIELERATGNLRSVPVRAPERPEETITLFTAAALGQIRNEQDGLPGYLLCRFEEGRLTSAVRCTLDSGRDQH